MLAHEANEFFFTTCRRKSNEEIGIQGGSVFFFFFFWDCPSVVLLFLREIPALRHLAFSPQLLNITLLNLHTFYFTFLFFFPTLGLGLSAYSFCMGQAIWRNRKKRVQKENFSLTFLHLIRFRSYVNKKGMALFSYWCCHLEDLLPVVYF